ncbi:barstar family protein [Streptomyces albipurpureus]|uniref:Barstar family protein n=1 Tax=Streptomyces albipurpureus TaxID=2897419 RepID=A0ABT0UPU4_9ACTN|nr:barstar family protein [Streptomyces sp. CWNU-1]MCM2390009.1 barstar family protein [Streptomyces sp. CWNU-1]
MFALVRDEDDAGLALCAEVSGLYAEPLRTAYQLLGCVPSGPLKELLDKGSAPISARLDDLWIRPLGASADLNAAQPSDLGEDSEHPAWLLSGVMVTGARRHPADPTCWDVSLQGVDGHLGPPRDLGPQTAVVLHTDRGECGRGADFSDVLLPDDAEPAPSLTLLGCAPGPVLKAALASGTRRSLRLGPVVLEVLGRDGAVVAECRLQGEVRDWRPSAHGPGLLDLDLDGRFWDPVPLYAREVWERWRTSPPTEPGLWSAYDRRERGVWLDLVCSRAARTRQAEGSRAGRTRPADQPAGRVYELDGRHATDEPGLYCALGEAINGPGGYFGSSTGGLDDCLRGGFGARAPATLIWRGHQIARESLGRVLAWDGQPFSYFEMILDILRDGRMDVVLE